MRWIKSTLVYQILERLSSYLSNSIDKYGAPNGIRTRDLILTMDALYQLSYRGVIACRCLASNKTLCVNRVIVADAWQF